MSKINLARIEGFDYLVDDQGNVYSEKRGNTIISQFSYLGSTPAVQLYRPDGSGKVIKPVSRLVATAFIENPMRLRFVVHKNGDNKDNRAENLMWSASKKMDPMIRGERWKEVPGMPRVKVSSKGRVKHDGYLMRTVMSSGIEKVIIPEFGTRTVELLKSAAFRYSDEPKKKRNKLTVQQVAEIKRDYTKRQVTMQALADRYAVSKTAIHQVLTGESFAYIKPAENEENRILRPESPHDALNALKASIPVEVKNDELFEYFLYITRKSRGIYFRAEENAYNQGFTVFTTK